MKFAYDGTRIKNKTQSSSLHSRIGFFLEAAHTGVYGSGHVPAYINQPV